MERFRGSLGEERRELEQILACPSCSAERWNSYCESHSLRWFRGLLKR
jgi:hypothetical protein